MERKVLRSAARNLKYFVAILAEIEAATQNHGQTKQSATSEFARLRQSFLPWISPTTWSLGACKPRKPHDTGQKWPCARKEVVEALYNTSLAHRECSTQTQPNLMGSYPKSRMRRKFKHLRTQKNNQSLYGSKATPQGSKDLLKFFVSFVSVALGFQAICGQPRL